MQHESEQPDQEVLRVVALELRTTRRLLALAILLWHLFGATATVLSAVNQRGQNTSISD
ncbi:MAG: hypothetical protein GY788_22365 [bacterium]|nr:hypothetical protein [bacterium]